MLFVVNDETPLSPVHWTVAEVTFAPADEVKLHEIAEYGESVKPTCAAPEPLIAAAP